MKYKIYKLVHNDKVVYVGRTKMTLLKRKWVGYKHNTEVDKIYKECLMELIEETDDVSRERYWIEFYKDTVLNIQKGEGLNHKEYYKEYWDKNNERRLELARLAAKKYRENNPEKYKLSQTKYKQKIREQNENKTI